jgi:site-specific recombinase XerD
MSRPVLAFRAPSAPAAGNAAAGSWGAALERFLAGLHPSTRITYARHLRRFVSEVPADLTPAALSAYRAAILAAGRSPGTQALALAAVRSFLSWCVLQDITNLRSEVIKGLLRSPRAVVRRPYQVLDEAQERALLAAAVAAGPRDLAMVAVFLGAGLRVSEVAALRVSDLIEDGDGAALHVHQGKGKRDRTVPVGPEVARVLRQYLAATCRKLGADSGKLFGGLHTGRAAGSGLCARTIGYRLKTLLSLAGIVGKRISPHSLRHTYALRYLRHGGEVTALARLLGHASVEVTMRYVDHLSMRDLRHTLRPLPLPGE